MIRCGTRAEWTLGTLWSNLSLPLCHSLLVDATDILGQAEKVCDLNRATVNITGTTGGSTKLGNSSCFLTISTRESSFKCLVDILQSCSQTAVLISVLHLIELNIMGEYWILLYILCVYNFDKLYALYSFYI